MPQTDRTSTEALPQQSDAVARLFEFADDLLATLDRSGRFTTVNPAWKRALGWSREELLGSPAAELVHPLDAGTMTALHDQTARRPDAAHFEARFRCKDGTYRWLQWNVRLADDTWYTVARDMTDRRLLEQRVSRDPLTGLANRAAAIERLEVAIHRLERAPGLVGVLFVDLDQFKAINDARGHEVGDRLLCAAAGRLLDTVRSVDGVGRFGGDEFVIVVEDATEVGHMTEIARRVVAALERPIMLEHSESSLGASVGVAVTATTAATPQSLLREADIAMYQAKTRGGGCYVMFNEAPPRRSRRD